MRKDDRRAVLDAVDAPMVRSELLRRYPVVERDGLAPQGLVLWHKPQVGWLCVALLVNPAKPGQICFTATFSARRFEITAPLVAKYFGAGALDDDD